MNFTDEELTNYFALTDKADQYMRELIRRKRVEEMPDEYRRQV